MKTKKIKFVFALWRWHTLLHEHFSELNNTCALNWMLILNFDFLIDEFPCNKSKYFVRKPKYLFRN